MFKLYCTVYFIFHFILFYVCSLFDQSRQGYRESSSINQLAFTFTPPAEQAELAYIRPCVITHREPDIPDWDLQMSGNDSVNICVASTFSRTLILLKSACWLCPHSLPVCHGFSFYTNHNLICSRSLKVSRYLLLYSFEFPTGAGASHNITGAAPTPSWLYHDLRGSHLDPLDPLHTAQSGIKAEQSRIQQSVFFHRSVQEGLLIFVATKAQKICHWLTEIILFSGKKCENKRNTFIYNTFCFTLLN